MRQKSESLFSVICVVLASVFWGTTGIAASFTSKVSPLATGAFAMGLGGVLLVINARHFLAKDFHKLTSKLPYLVIGGLSVAIYPLAFYTAMKWSGVAIGNVISIASAPLFTVVLERLISKKQISLQWLISFVFGALGVTLLTLGKQHSPQVSCIQANCIQLNIDTSLQYWGIILGLVAGLSYATYAWAGKQMIDSGINSNSSMASMFGFSALLLLPSLFFTGDNLFATSTNSAVALYMAIVPMFLGYLLFGDGLRHIEASKITLITLLEPVVATLLAVVIVGEVFDIKGWIGMVLIVICLLFQIIKIPTKAIQHKVEE